MPASAKIDRAAQHRISFRSFVWKLMRLQLNQSSVYYSVVYTHGNKNLVLGQPRPGNAKGSRRLLPESILLIAFPPPIGYGDM